MGYIVYYKLDTSIEKYDLQDEGLKSLALILRAADTDNFHLHLRLQLCLPYLLAFRKTAHDHDMLAQGMVVHPARYSLYKFVNDEIYNHEC